MAGQCSHRRENRLAELAARQHGVVSRAQLHELGFPDGAVEHRIAGRRLRVVHRGVYAVGPMPLSRRGRWMAAVLACGPGAVLSHWSAAALWGFLRDRSRLPHVGAARSRRGDRSLVLHRSSLHADERDTRERIPVTSVPRTLLDLAAGADAELLARALDEADRLHLLELTAVEALLARRYGEPGTRRLADALAAHHEPAPTRSDLERRFLGLCSRARLPPPSVNVLVAGFEVDALWPARRLVVELDGYAHHQGRSAFEADRARDVALRLAGYDVLRFTHRQLVDDPSGVTATLAALLA